MSDRPLLMRPELVRASIDGRKTQTQRVVKPQPEGRVIDVLVAVPSFVAPSACRGVDVARMLVARGWRRRTERMLYRGGFRLRLCNDDYQAVATRPDVVVLLDPRGGEVALRGRVFRAFVVTGPEEFAAWLDLVDMEAPRG